MNGFGGFEAEEGNIEQLLRRLQGGGLKIAGSALKDPRFDPAFRFPQQEALDLNNPAFREALENLRGETFRTFNAFIPSILSASAARGFRPGSGIESALLARQAGEASSAFSRGAQGLIAREREIAFAKFMDQLRAARQLRLMLLLQKIQRDAQKRQFLSQLFSTGLGIGGRALGLGGRVPSTEISAPMSDDFSEFLPQL